MNSISNCNEKDCCNKQHPVPGNALLRSAEGFTGPLNVIFTATTLTQTLNRPIASVTIDTACLRCPKLLIDFAGILTTTPINTIALSTLNFTLFKTCKGSRQRQPIKTFSFSLNAIVVTVPQSQTLKFEFSPCEDQCEDCCTYTLDLTSITNIVPGTISFDVKGTMSILAVESCC